MAQYQRRRKKARRPRISNGIMGIGLIAVAATTLIMVRSGINQLSKVAASADYPTAARQYKQIYEEKGQLRALSALFSAQKLAEADSASKSQIKKDILIPEKMSIELTSSLVNTEAKKEERPETELIDIQYDTFRGKLLRIKDASRVFMGVPGPLGNGYSGKHLEDIIADYGALAGVNAGGFEDPNGMGSGGTPIGLVISEGELRYGMLYGYYEIVGLDKDNKLHCGWMTAQQALDKGIRDAACFGPTLISDGEAVALTRDYGYNPRTVIGQTEDGTMLILVIEGRQLSSIGATMKDAQQVMLDYGAVNAGNMDGGASSVMRYEGEQITISSSLYGARLLPSCWLVKPES
ncbi:MAG: phosphodiester glycosidase family protein [Oscillospiraceae bacterium]|nr:phosphodiester glycosidase family protein [Oscillospiraceae bacterium]